MHHTAAKLGHVTYDDQGLVSGNLRFKVAHLAAGVAPQALLFICLISFHHASRFNRHLQIK